MTSFYSERQLSDRFNVSCRTLQRWRGTGEGPPFTRLGQRRVVYPAPLADAWAATRTFAHRAEEMAAAGKRARGDGKVAPQAAA
jgi:hypothetical protein